ncbi:MAG: HepT-like ribonuclease domain-containing protein [bacterium]
MTDREYIQQKVQAITDDLALLVDFKDKTMAEIFADPIQHHAFNNIMQQIIQRAIDINHHIIADTDPKLLQSPASYRETFELMGKMGALPPELAADIAGSGAVRNVLVHEYDRVDAKRIDASRKKVLKLYPRYCRAVLSYVDK